MKMDEGHSPANGAASERPGTDSPEKTAGHRAIQEKSGNRRTRGSAVVNRSNAPTKRGLPVQLANASRASNGHPKPNGHEQISAASVDAGGHSDAQAADTPAASLPLQASSDHAAYAEVALTPNGGKRSRQTEAVSRSAATQPRTSKAGPRASGDDKQDSVQNANERLPGGDAPVPDDIADFIDEVHSRVDLFEVLADLLNSGDDKIKQRAIERILEMKYGKHAAGSEDPQQIIFDMPRPLRD